MRIPEERSSPEVPGTAGEHPGTSRGVLEVKGDQDRVVFLGVDFSWRICDGLHLNPTSHRAYENSYIRILVNLGRLEAILRESQSQYTRIVKSYSSRYVIRKGGYG
jgi:hypothetical protein